MNTTETTLAEINATLAALDTAIAADYAAGLAEFRASDKSPAARAAFESSAAFTRFQSFSRAKSDAKRAPEAIANDGKQGVNASAFIADLAARVQTLA